MSYRTYDDQHMQCTLINTGAGQKSNGYHDTFLSRSIYKITDISDRIKY